MQETLKKAAKAGMELNSCDSLKELVNSFDVSKNGPRIIMFSLPHGKPVDIVLDQLLPLLEKGDVLIDGGNEWWEEVGFTEGTCSPANHLLTHPRPRCQTERRQKQAHDAGIHFIGCGVSGGYQSARRGPSMSPGCTPEAYRVVESRFKKWAAKDKDGKPCVDLIGPGGE